MVLHVDSLKNNSIERLSHKNHCQQNGPPTNILHLHGFPFGPRNNPSIPQFLIQQISLPDDTVTNQQNNRKSPNILDTHVNPTVWSIIYISRSPINCVSNVSPQPTKCTIRRKNPVRKYDPPYIKKPMAKHGGSVNANHRSVEEVSLDGSNKLITYGNQASFR